MLVKGERYFLPATLPKDYNIAHYLQEAAPYTDEPIPEYNPNLKSIGDIPPVLTCNTSHTGSDTVYRLVTESYDANIPLPGRFTVHFGGCILFIGRMATKITRRRRQLASGDVESGGNSHSHTAASTDIQDGSGIGSMANRSPRTLTTTRNTGSGTGTGSNLEHMQGRSTLDILSEQGAHVSDDSSKG